MRERSSMWLVWFLIVSVLVPCSVIWDMRLPWLWVYPVIYLCLNWLWLVGWYLLLRRFFSGSWLAVSFSLMICVYLGVVLMMSVWRLGGDELAYFDIFLLFDSLRITFSTLIKVYDQVAIGIAGVLLVCMLSVAGWVVYGGLRYLDGFEMRVSVWLLSGLVVGLTVVLYFAPVVYSSPLNQIQSIYATWLSRQRFRPMMPVYAPVAEGTGDNVIILQLESLNSLVMDEEYGGFAVDDEVGERVRLPGLLSVAADGVLVPNLVSAGVQTNRAMEALFCGVTGNIGNALSYGWLAEQECVPHLFSDMGYVTRFWSSFDDGSFMNLDTFLHEIGFEEVAFGTMMEEDDRQYDWGADDCDFYERALEMLAEPRTDPLFMYMEVSAHHYPFESRGYDSVHMYTGTNLSDREHYVNSLLEQDYCLGVFYDGYRELEVYGTTHLVVTADTAWPLTFGPTTRVFHGAQTTSSLVPLAYVPPGGLSEPVVRDMHAGQSELGATLLELVTELSQPGSFAQDLNGAEMPTCSVFTQPYGGGYIAVYDDDTKYTLSVREKKLTQTDLTNDLFERRPTVLEEGIHLPSFWDRYACDRYVEGYIRL